jgi:hypothetical protein
MLELSEELVIDGYGQAIEVCARIAADHAFRRQCS